MIKWMIVSHAKIMKNHSIDQLKWNWVGPQAERPNAASAKLNPCLNTLCPLSGLTAAVVSGGGTEELMSPDGSLKGDGLESPLWPLLLVLQDCPPTLPPSRRLVSGCLTFQMTSGHCPCQSCLTLNSSKICSEILISGLSQFKTRKRAYTDTFS